MPHLVKNSMIFSFILFAIGCESFDSNTDGHHLSVRAEPSTAGIVLTSGVAEGDVEAIAIPNRNWQFGYWSGDIDSFENPLDFKLREDTELVANFALFENEYIGKLKITGINNSIDLEFGQVPGATDMFDTNIDEEIPPPPPGNMVYAWFEFAEIMLRKDFRNAFTDEISWTLKYQPGDSETLAVEWEINEKNFTGSVILTNPKETFVINMMDESSVNIQAAETDELRIVYNYESIPE